MTALNPKRTFPSTQKDLADAYLIYRAACSDFDVHLDLIRQQNARFRAGIRRPGTAIAAPA